MDSPKAPEVLHVEDFSLTESSADAVSTSDVVEEWRRAVAINYSRPTIWTKDSQTTYGELDVQTRSLAAQIQRHGVAPGEVVAVCVFDRARLPLALLGCARSGAIYCPLDPTLPSRRVEAILEETTPALLLTDREILPSSLSAIPSQILESAGTCSGADLLHQPDGSDVLALLFTSGSTGRPKGVPLTHCGVVNEALAMAERAGVSAGDRALQFTAPGFDASLEEILSTLLSGATLAPRPDEIASSFPDFDAYVRESEITVLNLPTAFWIAWCSWMAAEDTRLPDSVRCTIIGGERATARAVEDWHKSGGERCKLINAYGPTEASIAATVHEITSCESDPPIGVPLPGYRIRLMSEDGSIVREPGQPGELWIGGVGLSPGYWKREDLTAAAFRNCNGERFYRTGDNACWTETGELHFIGRADHQIKIRGNRIEPAEVIHVLESFPGVGTAHVDALSCSDSLVLSAWIKWSGPVPKQWPATIAKHAAESLPVAAVPTRWMAVDRFPLTERGKLDRGRLPVPTLTAAGADSNGDSAGEQPSTPTEIALAQIWSGLLKTQGVRRNDSFFSLGGHSLLALQLFANIAKQFNVTIAMGALIEAPTLRSLSVAIKDARAGNTSPGLAPIVPIRRSGSSSPLFCIHGGDGGVIFYQNLSDHLQGEKPLLAIESPALGRAEDPPQTTVVDTASQYLKAVRSEQANGPYYLCGYSFGGLVAYEMACQLVEAGESVAFLGVYDSINPQAPRRAYRIDERIAVHWQHYTEGTVLNRAKQTVERVKDAYKLRREIRVGQSTGHSEPYSELRALQVRERNSSAYDAYTPTRLSRATMTLFKTTEPDDKFETAYDYGWGDVVENLDIVELPGEHLSMFDSRHIGELATATHLKLTQVEGANSVALLS